jgi:hypothetical protein
MLTPWTSESKFIKNIVFTCLAALLLTSCDFLQVEPKQSISSEVALNTEANVKAALNGAYNDLSDGDLYGGQYMMSPDLLADAGDVQWVGTFESPAAIIRKNIQPTNAFVESQWTDAYEAINVANNVLNALDKIEDPQERERIEGEARFIRGALYFELVRLFGKPWNAGDPGSNMGVPLILEPTRSITEEDNVTRNTVQEVYDQVFTDLDSARVLLPESNGVFADTYVASAFLSRVHLMQGNYGDAAEAADQVLQSDQFQLAPTFAGAFNNVEDIPEYIFAIQISSQDGSNELNTFYAASTDGGRGDINILQPHLNRYDPTDARGDFFYTDPSTGDVRTRKWQDDEADGANIPIVRLAEMYLTRAEANLRAGSTVGAPPVDDVNTIRNRAGLDSVNTVTVDDVLRQRRLELSFEGNLLHDLKRTERSVGSLSFDAEELVYPIPQRECDANPEITQNPGYTDC